MPTPLRIAAHARCPLFFRISAANTGIRQTGLSHRVFEITEGVPNSAPEAAAPTVFQPQPVPSSSNLAPGWSGPKLLMNMS